MTYRLLLLPALVGTLTFSMLPAHVAAFTVTPGKWQFDYESTSPMSPEPQKKTETECVKEAEWDPMESIGKSSHCKVSNVTHDSTSFSASVSCGRGKGNTPMTGSMQYTSTSTAMTGRTAFKGEGYDMEMKTNGTRLGECD